MRDRRTRQRHAIRDAFEQAARPLAPREVLEIARDRVPGLGIATVYRAVKRLVEQGELEPVELPGAPSRYERAGLAHHHHFRCRTCDRVYDVDGCPERVAELVPAGFRLEAHDVVLYGQCSACVGIGPA